MAIIISRFSTHVPGLYIKEEIGSTKIKPIFSICIKICKDNVCIFCGLLLKKNLGNPKQKNKLNLKY